MMKDRLYKKLCNVETLARAWHLARNDTLTDFIEDSFKYNDFAFTLEENLKSISAALRNEQYRPSPLIRIDVPKSTLTVRPGSVISIEDRIVLFAITLLIAPRFDKRLPETVYSYRLKRKIDNKSLFNDLEILKFPFLKKRTIRKRIDIVEPWYGQWPKFVEKTTYVFEKEGYNYLAVSDISAYFENINLRILKDNLMEYLPKEQKTVNLLCYLLEYWAWPTIHGLSIERGIPQGNDVSNFIGNIYLLPLDERFSKFCATRDIRYFRYMDDVRIFSKEEDVAREALFIMNEVLRKLHLNIQGGKTRILAEKQIQDELIDERLDKVNELIKEIQKNRKLITKAKRLEYIDMLKKQSKRIRQRGRIASGKDLRLYRRILTGLTLLNSSYFVDSLLRQIPQNPDERLLAKSVSYLRNFSRSSGKIQRVIMQFLQSHINLFPYQEARLMELLRYLTEISGQTISFARKAIHMKNKHWYVKVECVLLLANLRLKKRSLDSLLKLYQKETNIEIQRALVKCLCQLEKRALHEFLRDLTFENDRRLFSLGRMLFSMIHDHGNAALNEISNIFRTFDENFLMASFYKIDVIKHCSKKNVREQLLKRLLRVKQAVKRKHLNQKLDDTIALLQTHQD